MPLVEILVVVLGVIISEHTLESLINEYVASRTDD
jgi:hypothetical protein